MVTTRKSECFLSESLSVPAFTKNLTEECLCAGASVWSAAWLHVAISIATICTIVPETIVHIVLELERRSIWRIAAIAVVAVVVAESVKSAVL